MKSLFFTFALNRISYLVLLTALPVDSLVIWVKHELRVTSLKLKSTSRNSKVRVHIHELRVQIHELRVQIHELRVQIHESLNQ